MEMIMSKPKKGLIIKTWKRCLSIGRNETKKRGTLLIDEENDKKPAKKRQVAPDGCFSVYVGPQKQRFVIKIEYVNHPLFQMLLEEAESEYGYNSEGPLSLACNIDLFYKILVDMDYSENIGNGCGFKRSSYSPYRLRSPSRIVSIST